MHEPRLIPATDLLAILDFSPYPTVVYQGDNLVVLSANIAMLDLWGKERNILGQSLVDAVPEILGVQLDRLRAVWRSGKNYVGKSEPWLRKVNELRGTRSFDFEYKIILNEKGEPAYILHTAIEVSPQQADWEGREEMYRRVGENELLFTQLLDVSPVAIAYLDGPELMIRIANDMILDIWGKGAGVIGIPLAHVLPELKEQPFLDLLRKVYRTGEPFFGDAMKATLNRDGTPNEIFLNFVYKAVTDTDGTIIGILVVATDVTEHILIKNEVEEVNTRLKIAMDASKLGSTEVVIATGNMQSTDQFKANYGYRPEEDFRYADLFNAMFPEYRDPVKQMVRHAMDTNGIYKTEYPVRWRDGSVHWIQAHGRPRYDKDGVADRMVGMTLDITERKLFEQRKDDFLSIASHELKTPVTSLKASIQLLERIKKQAHSDLHERLIEQSHKSVVKISQLVDDLLNMKRMSEGQLQLRKSWFNLYEMLEASCNHIKLESKSSVTIFGDPSIQLYADEHRIEQVVINFVNNAVKYAPDSKEIHIHVQARDTGIKVSVQDYGKGIDQSELSSIFDRYYRRDYAGQNYSGLGLGLYICAEIIQKHGGSIGVESTLGEGATFWFTVPIY